MLMKISEGEKGLIIMHHDDSIEVDKTALSNPIKRFLNERYSKTKKSQNFKYKITFEIKENKIFLDNLSGDSRCKATDFSMFYKNIIKIIINSEINEIILPKIANNLLARYLQMKGFHQYKEGIKNDLYGIIQGEKEYLSLPGYRKIISRDFK